MYNVLYKCEDQREINLSDPKENTIEIEGIIPVMKIKFYRPLVLQDVWKKGKCPVENGITIDLIK